MRNSRGYVNGAVLLVGVLVLWVAMCLLGDGGVRIFASRAFLTAWAVFVGSLALSVVLAAGLWRAGRPYRQTRRAAGVTRRVGDVARDERGAAIVEFALVLPFLLMLGLLMAQSALLMTGIVVVHYSAHCAVRTAVTAVPLPVVDDEGALLSPRNELPDEDGVKYARIREAALWAVTPISCGSRQVPAADCEAVGQGISAHWASYNRSRPGWLDVYDSLPHRVQYAADNTTVTIRPPQDGQAFGEHEDLVVEVSHVFYLGVPYAGRVLSALMGDDGRTLSAPTGGYGVMLHATSRLPNQGAQDFVDIERFQDESNSES